MKKKFLSIIPMVALLASCGSDPMAAVSQTLPNDVEKVDSKADPVLYTRAVDEIFDGMNEMDYEAASYHLSVDYSMSESGSVRGVSISGSARVSGDLYFGFEQAVVEKEKFSYVYLEAKNLTVFSNMNMSQQGPESIAMPSTIDFKNVNFGAYLAETEAGALGILDLSDHALQDGILKLLLDMGYELEGQESGDMYISGANDMLDMFLGEKIKDSNYRPGLVSLNLSELLEAYDALQAKIQDEYVPLSESEIKHPVSFVISEAMGAIDDLFEQVQAYLPMILAAVEPAIGVELEHTALGDLITKSSLAANVSSADLCSKLNIDPSEFPVSGYAGILISVGMDTGANYPVLEELKLAANVSYSMEGLSVSINGHIYFDGSYEDKASIREFTGDVESATDLTDLVIELFM